MVAVASNRVVATPRSPAFGKTAGILLREDNALPAVDMPRGRATFFQMVAIDEPTLARARTGPAAQVLEDLAKRDPLLCAD